MISRKFVVLAAASVAVNGLALAESMNQSSSSSEQGSSMQSSQQQLSPQQFVSKAASGSAFEVQSAKLAEKTSTDPQIKQVAKDLQKDHQKATKELDKAARKSGVTVSQNLQPEDQQMLDNLKNKTGKEFDQAYLQDQVQAHQKAIALYQQASSQLQDQNLKDYAQKILPKLEQHQAMIQKAQSTAQGQSNQSQAQPAGSSLQGSSDQHSTQQPRDRVPANEGGTSR